MGPGMSYNRHKIWSLHQSGQEAIVIHACEEFVSG